MDRELKDISIDSFSKIFNFDYSEFSLRDILLVLRELLNDYEYFVVYYRYFCINSYSLEQIASIIGVTDEYAKQIVSKIFNKITSIMQSKMKLTQIIDKVKNRENNNYLLLRIEPKNPDLIIKYLYLKDIFTLEEKKLFYYLYFTKYYYDNFQIMGFMKISDDEFSDIYSSLLKKMNDKLANTNKFRSYRDSILKNYGTKIFAIDLKSDLKIINYDDIHDKYTSLNYEQILELFEKSGYELSHDELVLLEKFYRVPSRSHKMNEEMLLSDINLTVLGYKNRSTDVPKHKLYEVYLENLDDFNEEQRLFLECYFFNKRDKSEFKSAYKDSSLVYRYHYLIDRLERSYYNIYRFFDNNFDKKEYLDFKKKYGDKLSDFRIEILDQVYGLNGEALSISKLAEKYNMDYIRMHDLISDAREAAIAIYAGRRQKIEIDKGIYAPYVKNYAYDFIPETREILSFFLIDDMDYGEIAEEMGLTRYRVSNIITDGIRKIDNYRFGLSEVLRISPEELEDFFLYFDDKFDDEEREVLRLKLLYYMDNPTIAIEMGLENEQVNRYVRHFNVLYYSYRIKDVSITRDEIESEINRHISDSVLNEREKEIASLFYGIKNKYNNSGRRYTSDEIKEMLHISKNAYYNLFQNITWGVKGRKIGINKPSYLYIERDKLDELLDDSHLPISDKEREIICYMFELKGYPYKTIYELPEIFGDTRASLSRRYQRAIVSIYKYLNKEIDGSLNYEIDILPNMKYFSLSDRKIIEKYFKDGMSVESLANEYNVGFEKMLGIVRRIKTSIFDFLNNPKAKKFDFDYYMKVRYEDDLPFYGELEKTIQIFDLFYGMNDGLRMSVPEIARKLDLGIAETSINKAANYLMLSVCKHKDGIRRSNMFSYEEIKRYYELHCDEMNYYHKQFYLRYFEKFDNPRRITGITSGISYIIMNDLLRDTRKDYITLESLDRKKAIELIKSYRELSGSTKRELMYMFDITGKEFMNGKEFNHLYRLLSSLDSLLLEKGCVLKKD